MIICIAFRGNYTESFVDSAIPLVEIFFIVVFLVVGSVWCVEYTDDKIRYLLIANNSRAKLYMAKYVTVCVGVSTIHLLYSLIVLFFTGFTASITVVLLLQWVLTLGLASFLVAIAIALRKLSYLTAFMVVLFLAFRFLLMIDSHAWVVRILSYFELHYDAIYSVMTPYNELPSSIALIAVLWILLGLLSGFLIFAKQDV